MRKMIALAALLGVLAVGCATTGDPKLDTVRNLERAQMLVEVVGNELVIYLEKRGHERVEEIALALETGQRLLREATAIYAEKGELELADVEAALSIVRDAYLEYVWMDTELTDMEKAQRRRRVESIEAIVRVLVGTRPFPSTRSMKSRGWRWGSF